MVPPLSGVLEMRSPQLKLKIPEMTPVEEETVLCLGPEGVPDGGHEGVVRRLRLWYELMRLNEMSRYTLHGGTNKGGHVFWEDRIVELDQALSNGSVEFLPSLAHPDRT